MTMIGGAACGLRPMAEPVTALETFDYARIKTSDRIFFVHKRNKYTPVLERFSFKPLIKILTGMRRVGKSTLLRLWAGDLKKAHPRMTLLEVDKEKMEWDHVRTGADLHREVKRRFSKATGKKVLMVDEVQEIQDWERAVASLLKEGGVDIYLTGSNARVFSGELATALTGRYVEVPVHPLTYPEFLEFSGDKEGDTSFARFLRHGGMPGIHALAREDVAVFDYLSAIGNTVVLKDVVSRHAIRNVRLLENVLRFVLDTSGSPVSSKRISDYLRSQQIKTSADTILEYLQYFEDARVLHRVRRHDLRGRKILETHEKYYAADAGIRNAILGFRDQDIGIQLEAVVYLHLRANGYRVEVGRWGEREIDFVATREGRRIYIQVAYLLGEKSTLERELQSLRMIGDGYPRLILSLDTHFREDHEGVRWQNLRKFLMGDL